MAKFRKKPVVIEAWQIAPKGEKGDAPLWVVDAVLNARVGMLLEGGISIDSAEGMMRGDVGDWLIKGVKGELYPCKPDIFAATYESADSGEVK